jgi:hypothetical protein
VTDDRDSQRTETMAQRDARLMRIQNDVPDYAIKKAVGAALRRAREAEEWSRTEFVALLPSGIGERTLLSYELAPRGALFYPPRSGEGLEDLSLGLMAYLDPKW